MNYLLIVIALLLKAALGLVGSVKWVCCVSNHRVWYFQTSKTDRLI